MADIKTIAIIGASGRTGEHVVREAIARGLKVRAGYYSKPLSIQHVHVKWVKCDITKKSDLRRLLRGTDAVISVVGHSLTTKSKMQTRGMTIVEAVMHEYGIRRLISLTGIGVRVPGDQPSWHDRLITRLLTIADPKRMQDGAQHYAVLQTMHDIDWTMVRVYKLTNKLGSRTCVLHKHNVNPKLLVRRVAVAKHLIDCAKSNLHVHCAPVVSRP